MVSLEVDSQFRECIRLYKQQMNWHWLPTAEYKAFAQLWTDILADEDMQRLIQRTLYIPWERPVESHGRYMVSFLDHLRGRREAAPYHLNFYPDVRLTEATIASIKVADPNDGEMCIVTYTYPVPHLLEVSTTVDYVYALQGNQWHQGMKIPCKFRESHPYNHRLKELSPDL